MNTGKVVNLDGPAYGITDNLRVGPDYNPPQPETHFSYTGDRHSFARAALRCVGVGECRREGGGTMCPSYMVTREEKHSTRGRARMLFEMMNGEVIEDGWKSEEVKDALDLCLSCKGCKGDCPVNVDMATYKAEFLSHYYEGGFGPATRMRSDGSTSGRRSRRWRRRLANLFTQTPGLSGRPSWPPAFTRSGRFRLSRRNRSSNGFASHEPKHPGGPPVVLFADTFNNHFHPDVAIAADGGAGRRRLSREVPDGRRLLRPAALRLRLSGHGQALVDRPAGEAAAVLSGRHPDGGARAELLGGFQGRAVESVAQQRGREAAQGSDFHA